MKLLGTYMACWEFEGYILGPLGRVHENYCTGDNVRKCTHAMFCITYCIGHNIWLRFLVCSVLLFLPVFPRTSAVKGW